MFNTMHIIVLLYIILYSTVNIFLMQNYFHNEVITVYKYIRIGLIA